MSAALTPEEVEARLRARHSKDGGRQSLEWIAADTIADLRRSLTEARAKCDRQRERIEVLERRNETRNHLLSVRDALDTEAERVYHHTKEEWDAGR